MSAATRCRFAAETRRRCRSPPACDRRPRPGERSRSSRSALCAVDGEEVERRIRRRARLDSAPRAPAFRHRCRRAGSGPDRRRRAASACRCGPRATATLPMLTMTLRVARIVVIVGQPAQPSERLAAVRHAGVPEAHRREMRQARVVVAAAMDDGQLAVLVETLEADHRRMEAKAVGDLDAPRARESRASAAPGSTRRHRTARPYSSRHCRPTAR